MLFLQIVLFLQILLDVSLDAGVQGGGDVLAAIELIEDVEAALHFVLLLVLGGEH